jgi:hypothetical protein
VLFLVFGASASGKTTLVRDVVALVDRVEAHDFDELEPPPGADTAWRHRAYTHWLSRALDLEGKGTALLLCGQTPLGEVLAAPAATELEALSACLVDCDDPTRAARLEGRGSTWFARTAGALQSDYTWPEWVSRHLMWADWLRRHAADPTWRPDVIRIPETEREMHWGRWSGWTRGDPRWQVHTIDTTKTPPPVAAERLAAWIAAERALLRCGVHPLARGRWAG